MPYCTVDNVQSLIPLGVWNHDAVGADPTSAEVETWITEVDREIDSVISARYSLPITGPESLELLCSISARLTATRIWGVAFTARTGDASIPEDWRQARKFLESLGSGAATLPDAESLGGSTPGAPGSPIHSYPPIERREGDLDAKESEVRMDQEF